MSCDLCNCEDHPNRPCPHCLNCVGHYEQVADWDQDHTDHTEQLTEYTEDSGTVGTKPHYRYDASRGVFVPKNPPVQKIVE